MAVVSIPGPLADFDPGKLDRVFRTDVRGTFVVDQPAGHRRGRRVAGRIRTLGQRPDHPRQRRRHLGAPVGRMANDQDTRR